MTGLTLAEALTERFPMMNLIFVTAYGPYALDAYRVYASGFLVRPVSGRQLRAELAHLRHPVLTDTHLDVKAAGERVERCRTMAGITLRELAEAMSVTVQTVGRWELGNRVPDLAAIARLARVLGVNVESLMIV